MTYGAFWLTLFATLEPGFSAFTAYAPAGTPPADVGAAGLASTGFNASFGVYTIYLVNAKSFGADMMTKGFYMLFMGLLNFVFLICSIKTDIVHVIIFTTLVIAFGLLTGEYFYLAMSQRDTAIQLSVVRNSS